MKPILLKITLLTIIAMGVGLPARASDTSANDNSSTPKGPRPEQGRFFSDKPEIKTLFRHTRERSYDIKSLSWYGGVMERIVAENHSERPITVTFQVTKLSNGVIAAPAQCTKVKKVCAPGKSVIMMDLLSNDGNTSLVYHFSHGEGKSDLLTGNNLSSADILASR